MQARAIFEATAQVLKLKKKVKVNPEIMIPLVGFQDELDNQVAIVHRVAKEVQKAKGVKINYLVGTMIEVPRAAVTAAEITKTAQFFSFGTNDLTQTTLGMSRDDAGSFSASTRISTFCRRIHSPRSIRQALDPWFSKASTAANPPTRTSSWESAVSTAEIPLPLSSAIELV